MVGKVASAGVRAAKAKPKAKAKPATARKRAPRPGEGRPKSLRATPETLALIEGLGRIQATDRECAAALKVSLPTFKKFRDEFPSVGEKFDLGQGEGFTSLRRKQFEAAEKGNPTMLIWLGKQWLGQTDKVVNEHTGKDGDAIRIEQVNLDAEAFTSAIAGLAARSAEASGTGEVDANGEGAT